MVRHVKDAGLGGAKAHVSVKLLGGPPSNREKGGVIVGERRMVALQRTSVNVLHSE